LSGTENLKRSLLFFSGFEATPADTMQFHIVPKQEIWVSQLMIHSSHFRKTCQLFLNENSRRNAFSMVHTGVGRKFSNDSPLEILSQKDCTTPVLS